MVSAPVAFLMVPMYGLAWIVFYRESFSWASIATLATWFMTLLIQRAAYRDTQAIHAKLDELLRAQRDASSELTHSVKEIAAKNPAVLRVNGMLTAQLAPDQIVVALSLEFKDDLRVPELEERVIEIETSIRRQHGEVTALFIKPQTPKVFSETARERFGNEGDG